MPEQNLLQVFLKGTLINLCFNNSKEWIKATIIAIEDSVMQLELEPIKVYAETDLSFGDSVFCKYVSDANEYFAEGWISKLETDDSIKAAIQIHRWGKSEVINRSAPLHEVFLGCVVKINPDDKGTFSMVNMISENEIVFTSKANLKETQKILLEVLITDKITYKSPAEISSIKEMDRGTQYTAGFIDTSTLNKTIIDNFIKELKSSFSEENKSKNLFWKQHSKYNKILGV